MVGARCGPYQQQVSRIAQIVCGRQPVSGDRESLAVWLPIAAAKEMCDKNKQDGPHGSGGERIEEAAAPNS